jgi:hypothetical protein
MINSSGFLLVLKPVQELLELCSVKKSLLRKLVQHHDLLFRKIGEANYHLQESAKKAIPEERSINKLT